MKYRKKPVVIEAVPWVPHAPEEIIMFFRENEFAAYSYDDVSLFIETLEGTHEARPNDWVIKGVQGEFYPCSRTFSR